MKKHLGICLALGLGALLSFTGREANAATLTITISYMSGGTSHVITASTNGQNEQAGSTVNNFTANTQTINSAIAGTGADFQFSGLNAHSNNPGSPAGATLTLGGELSLNDSASSFGPITILATLDGYTTPTGTGTLFSSSSATFTNSDSGAHTDNSSGLISNSGTYSTPTSTYTSTGITPPNSGSNGSGTSTVANVPVGTTYSLTDTSAITLSGVTGQADITFGVGAKFVTVPEPASLVMMLTGMPLPLVVMGLLRRRRGA